VSIVEKHLAAKADGWTPTVSVWKPGSYESWASVIGEAIVHAGLPAWGEGIEHSRATADPETLAYRSVAEAVAAHHFDRYGNVDSTRFDVRGAVMADIVAGIEHWAGLTDGKQGAVLSRLAWRVINPAVGRTWEIPATDKRMAGRLTFREVATVSSARMGVFEWRIKE
jgi:hypothetical protein